LHRAIPEQLQQVHSVFRFTHVLILIVFEAIADFFFPKPPGAAQMTKLLRSGISDPYAG
jgi:hypothetical protein